MLGIALFLVALAAAIPLTIFIGWLPGYVARERRHSKAEAIALCGWVSLFFWPLWFAAMIWAHTEDNRKAQRYGSNVYVPSKAERENRIEELDEEVAKAIDPT